MVEQIFNLSSYKFNVYALFPMLVGFLTLGISIIALIHENYSRASKTLFLLATTLIFWLFNCGMIYLSFNYSTALFWTKIEHIGVAYIPFSAALFTIVILKKIKELKYYLLALFIFCSFSLLLIFTSDIFLSGLYHYNWGYFHKYGLFGLIYISVFALSMVINLYLQSKEFKKAKTGSLKNRIRTLLIAYCIAYIGAVDFVPAYGFTLYPFGYLPIFIFLILITRAIWRYNLGDISPTLASKEIIRNMNDILLITDANGFIRLLNPAGESFFKLREKDLIDRHISGIINYELFKMQETDKLIDNVSKIKNHEVTYETKNREERILNFSLSVLKNSSGNPLGILLTAKDRTEYVKAINDIKEAYKYTQAILETIPVGILILDMDKKIKAINKTAIKMMGLESEDEAIGKDCNFKMICPNKEVNCPVDNEIDKKITSESIMIGPNKKKILLLKTSLKTVLNGENVVLEAFIDITKRKDLEKQLNDYKDYLEDQVEERTKKLQETNRQLLSEVDIRKQVAETLNEKVLALEKCREDTIKREAEMIEIKKMVNSYCSRLKRPKHYNLSFLKKQD